jgi:DNA-binding IclR family transcriptional regulator
MKILDTLLALAGQTQGASPQTLASLANCSVAEIEACLEIFKTNCLAEDDPQYAGRVRLGDRAAGFGMAGRYVEMRMLAWPHLQDLHKATGRAVSIHVLEGHWQRAIDECPRHTAQALQTRPLRSYRDGRILRFGSTALAILAHLPAPEIAAVLALTSCPPSAQDIEDHPQWAHLKSAPMDLAAWDAASPSAEELRLIRERGYAFSAPGSRSSMGGHALTAPLFERGGRVCAGLCVFGERIDGRPHADDVPLLLKSAQTISRQFGYLE